MSTNYVPRYTSPEGLDLLRPLPRLSHTVGELLAFAHTLRTAGLDLGPRIEKIEAIWDAAQSAMAYSVAERVAAIDIDTVDPGEVADIVSEAALAHVARLQTSFHERTQDSGIDTVVNEFDRSLRIAAGQALRNDADRLVQELRAEFDKAAKVIQSAYAAGLSKDTKESELLTNGSSAAISAYRKLPDAVASLDRIAALRIGMVRHLGYEANLANPPHEVCAFIADVKTELELGGAENTWDGEIEHVQIDGLLGGSSIYRARKHFIGGAWLELLRRGYTLRLNTATEAGDVAQPKEVA
ncbi:MULTISPECIES: hypothetical protein [unclassified Aeromicrobium]|uniref:hypothetical protein n=1 Tax=unclassified Aeromicrobium TaxID=2633570 RepID=UPI00396B419D